MGKKFSIAKAVDLNKLSENIQRYTIETGEFNPYIFMNEETIREMRKDYLERVDVLCEQILKSKYPNGLIGKYEGYKIYQDNNLKFGEVEIR